MPNLFNDHDYNRHMPFAFEDKLLFCQSICEDDFLEDQGVRQFRTESTKTRYRAYRVCVGDLDVENNSVSNAYEIDCCHHKNIYCSPSAYRDENGKINLIYVKENVMNGGRHFCRAYRRVGDDFKNLSEPKHIKEIMGVRNYCYAENNNYRAVASSWLNRVYIMLHDKKLNQTSKIALGHCSFLRRISIIDGTNNMLVTYPQSGKDAHNSSSLHLTEMIDLDSLEVSKIHTEDKCIYKSTIKGNKIIYSHKDTGQDNYCMDLKIAEFSISGGKIMPSIQHVWDF